MVLLLLDIFIQIRYNAKNILRITMKKIIITLLLLSNFAFAFDFMDIATAVDNDKAIESVDKEKAIAAASKGTDIEMKDVTDSVDGDKAIESVDKAKLFKALF